MSLRRTGRSPACAAVTWYTPGGRLGNRYVPSAAEVVVCAPPINWEPSIVTVAPDMAAFDVSSTTPATADLNALCARAGTGPKDSPSAKSTAADTFSRADTIVPSLTRPMGGSEEAIAYLL